MPIKERNRMEKKIRIIQIGLGEIGQRIVKYLYERNGLKVVSAVDPAPDKCGKNLSELCGVKSDIKILSDIDYRRSVTNGIIQYFDQNQGATSKILRHLTKNFKPER